MGRRGLIILFLLSLAGYGLTLWLFPRVHPAAQWKTQLDRQDAISRAREIARLLEIDASNWEAKVSSANLRDEEFWLNKSTLAGPELKQFLTPILFSVKLTDLHTGRRFRVDLTAQGILRSVQYSPPRSLTSPQPNNDPLPAPERTARESQSLAYLYLLFPHYPKLAFTLSDASHTRNNSDLRYEGKGVRVRVGIREGELERAELTPEVTAEMRAEEEGWRGKWARRVGEVDNIYVWLLILMVAAYFLIAMSLGRLQAWMTLPFWALMTVLMFWGNIAGEFADRFRFNLTISGVRTGYWMELLVPWVLYGMLTIGMGFMAYTILAGGLAVYARLPNRRSIGLELLLRGRLLTKPVTGGVLVGLLAAGILSAIPLLVSVSGLFRGMELNATRHSWDLAGRFPGPASLITPDQFVYFVLFALIAPVIDSRIRGRAAARTAMLLVTVVIVLGVGIVYLPVKAMLVTAVLVSLCLTIVYYSFDLLAVMVAVMAGEAALAGASLMAQPNGSLRMSGMRVFAGLGVAMLISLAGYWRSREVSEEETAVPASLLETRAERERLKADFDVARRAQEKLLPPAPPKIPGFDIAAVCRPSKEVGGDLYDFIGFPDGRIGIVVADVSGKGVPASLYMTLTKGLLDSLSEELTDAGEILRQVNLHLYEVCRRKVFVTLFLGIIDPVGKTMQYARAGHNPTIHYRSADGRAGMLNAPGMGLGLGGSRVFDVSLKVSSVELAANDTLVFYSDGITEAMNQKKEEYGEERLMALAATGHNLTSEQMRDAIMADVGKFLGSVQPQDDQTLVVVRVRV